MSYDHNFMDNNQKIAFFQTLLVSLNSTPSKVICKKTFRLYELKGNLMIIENCNHKTALVTLVYLILFLRNIFVYFHSVVKKDRRNKG